MERTVLLILVLFLMSFGTLMGNTPDTNTPSQDFKKGYVVTNAKDTIYGQIKSYIYDGKDLKYILVQDNNGNTMKFTPLSIQMFSQEMENETAIFVSKPLTKKRTVFVKRIYDKKVGYYFYDFAKGNYIQDI